MPLHDPMLRQLRSLLLSSGLLLGVLLASGQAQVTTTHYSRWHPGHCRDPERHRLRHHGRDTAWERA